MNFASVTYTDDLGLVAARINRITGDLALNSQIFPGLPEKYQDFILKHEQGHYVMQTDDEYLANQYAYRLILEERGYAAGTLDMLEVECFFNHPETQKYVQENIKKGKHESDWVAAVVNLLGVAAQVFYKTDKDKKDKEWVKDREREARKHQQDMLEKQRLQGMGSLVDRLILNENFESEAAINIQKTTINIVVGVLIIVVIIIVVLLIRKAKK